MLICFKKVLFVFPVSVLWLFWGQDRFFWVKVVLEGWRMSDIWSEKKKKKKDVGRRLACSGAVVSVPSQECRPFCRFCCCKMVQPDRRHNTATPRMMLSHWVCVCVCLTLINTHTHSSGMHGLGRAPDNNPQLFIFPWVQRSWILPSFVSVIV